jgi:hypothetical protein
MNDCVQRLTAAIRVDPSGNSCWLSSRGSLNKSGSGSGTACAQAKPALELRASTSDVVYGWLTWKKSDTAVWLDRGGDALQKR